jgi:hypothetical protein
VTIVLGRGLLGRNGLHEYIKIIYKREEFIRK